MKNIQASTIWRYAIYISISAIVTSGLNILHIKYILDIDPRPSLFFIPIVAGVFFGYLIAKLKPGTTLITSAAEGWIYLKYIVMSCFVTAVLNIVHTEWILQRKLEGALFIAPFIAGIFFGYLLARIKILNNRLLQLATTDTLTGAYNRLQFDRLIQIEIDRVKRYGGTFSIIYIDVDNFKEINDTLGHLCGDKVLVDLVNIIHKQNRQPDILTRYGGEEFIVLASNTHKEGAKIHAERLREKIACHSFEKIKQMTCSFGVAEYNPDFEDQKDVIVRADTALYKAKKSGRNKVEISI